MEVVLEIRHLCYSSIKFKESLKLLDIYLSDCDNQLIIKFLHFNKMDPLKNKVNNFFMAVATPFIGVLKDSKFIEKGVLTPEEFVKAGDQLTYKCPTWRYT